jgi:hypothetical protein
LNEELKENKLVLSCVSDKFEEINNDEEYNLYHVVLETEDEKQQFIVYAVNGDEYVMTETLALFVYNKNK